MTDTDTPYPHFILELRLTNTASGVKVEDPAILTDQIMDRAYQLLDSYLMDIIDEVAPDITDEQYREHFIHLCYKLVYREMTTLTYFPGWEQAWKARLGTRERGPRSERKPYG